MSRNGRFFLHQLRHSQSRSQPQPRLRLQIQHRYQHTYSGSSAGATKWARRTALLAAVLGGGWAYDHYVQASAVTRTLRAFCDVAIICLDYKLNFNATKDLEYLDQIHRRAARRLLNCCQDNGGLFIKFGQSIAVQSALLPSPFRKELSVLYDNAPSVPVAHIVPVIEQSFGRAGAMDELFIEFSEHAVASASVAQVHRARLRERPDQWVAVKVQKPEIKLQIGWDLFTFRTCSRVIEWVFGIPIMWSVGEVERRLREELDFEREANNSELATRDLASQGDRWLRRAVYIPRVFWGATRRQVLTTEWIDGTSLVHPEQLAAAGWSMRDVMQRMVALFAFQIFVSGNVHGDPHPGNILVRKHPDCQSSGRGAEPQLVLLDHGLYVRESRQFRRQYAAFWRAALLSDKSEMERIAAAWGMADAAMFATMVSLKPPGIFGPTRANKTRAAGKRSNTGSSRTEKTNKEDEEDVDAYAKQMRLKRRAIAALRESSNLPPELVFVVRNTNIVRANNQSLGIPVDRIRILGQYAAYGLRQVLVQDAWDPARKYDSHGGGLVYGRAWWGSRVWAVLRGEWTYVTFRLALWTAELGLGLVNVWAWVCRSIFSANGEWQVETAQQAFEENMRHAIEEKLGYRIDTSLFSA
ncbi:hypothetical protein GGI07_000950 [Coemansia sp. Benny D115]|nr:hypothetical protein GGI07_000950 [Coemansia sp. Benny D115]